MKTGEANKWILYWLWLGFFMILIQVLLGGITRLTGSGLSITRWDIITGIEYPLTEKQWNVHFDLYKQTPQYQKINKDFGLEQFKFIFFWEYIHRLWARIMGFVFLIPLIYFLGKGWIEKKLMFRLILIFLLAVFVASLGWIMVASGLLQRPWVNAYKLSFHLMSAVILLVYIFNTIQWIGDKDDKPRRTKTTEGFIYALFFLLFFQIFVGGVMAGMKAGLAAPTWPKIQGQWIPDELYNLSSFKDLLFNDYEISHSGPLVIQFLHRMVAYIIFLVIASWSIYEYLKGGSNQIRKLSGLLCLLFLQIFLGIWTVIHSVGLIPLWPAALHQLVGILMLVYLFKMYFTYESSPAK